jgi:hypothetical protein
VAEPPATPATPKKRGPPARVWQPAFLAALANSANVRAACAAAGVDRHTAYRHRERNARFRAAWDQALEEACDLLVATAWQRALSGLSDTLLIFLLKSHQPAVYREPPARVDITAYVRLVAERDGLDPDEVMADVERILRGG